MLLRVLTGCSLGVACLLFAAASQAACGSDNDCPGEQVCESGACVAPPPAAAASPAPAAPAPPVTPPAPVTRSIAAEPPETAATQATRRRAITGGKRHSTGMMVGGIITSGLAVFPLYIAFLGSLRCDHSAFNSSDGCDNSSYITGSLIVATALLAVGIPLIVIGSKREAAPSARLAPWATPQSAGLGLRLQL